MKAAFLAVVLLLNLLLAMVTYGRSPEREARALRHFSAEEVARGRRFAFERRLVAWPYQVTQLLLLGLLAFPPVARRLADAAEAWAGGRWPLALLAVAGVCFAAETLLSFPFSWYLGFQHLRAWGLTTRSLASWLSDYAKAIALSALVGAALTVGLYGLMRLWPRHWWAAAAAGSAVVGVFFAFVAPVLVAPLFNTFTPIRATRHAALQPRVEAMAAAAGLPVRDVLVMDASRQGKSTNAYFSGFGATRRIVLYDTLLDSHTPEETLSVLAHEIGHWRHDHIAKGLALGAAGALVGFFFLQRLLEWAAARGGLGPRAPFDAAGLPLVLLASWLAAFASAPLQNAVSRAFERQADRAALELGGDPAVFVAAEERLARDNIANLAPSDLAVFWFATHPPTLERIEMAEAWPTEWSPAGGVERRP